MAAFTASSANNSSQPVGDCTGSSQAKAPSALPVETIGQIVQGIVKPVPPKGRFASKLSSRHNRRKRRERENKDPSAKKSRGGRRNRERIPIPSFTPITDDYNDEGTVRIEDNTRVSETLKVASSACLTDSDSNTTTKIAIPAAVKAGAFMNNHSTNKTDEIQKSDRSHNIDNVTAQPAFASVPVKKQKITHKKNERRAIQQNDNHVSSGRFEAGQTGEDNQQATKQKSSYGDSTEIASGMLTPAPSTSKAAPQEQPFAQIADKHSSSSECLPSTVDISEMGMGQRAMAREEQTSSEGIVKGADKKLPEESENHPLNEMTTDEAETQVGDLRKETEHLEIPALPAIPPEKARSLMLNESISPHSEQPAGEKKKKCSNYFDKGICNVGAEIKTQSKNAGSVESGPLKENNSNDGKVIGMNSETHFDVNNDTKSYPRNETPGGNPLMVALPINPLLKKSKNSMLNKPCSPPLVRQADKKQSMCNNSSDKSIGNIGAKIKKRSQNVVSAKSGPPEVIEIIDCDDDCDIIDGATRKSRKERSLNYRTTTDKKAGAPGKKRKPKKSNKSKKSGKIPVSISRSSSDSSSGDELDQDLKKAKKSNDREGTTKRRNRTVKIQKSESPEQSKTPAGNKLCSACSSCKCDSRAITAATPQKVSSLSGSDARQEQSLVNRLQRIERDIAWKEGQRNNVARELKKRRGQMLKKWEGQSSNTKSQRPRFLADADVSEELGSLHSGSKEANRARSWIFGKQKTHQPTLTQILGSRKDEDCDEKASELDCNRAGKAQSNSVKASTGNALGAGLPDGGNDFLAFWDDSAPTKDSTQCIGSMNYYSRAVANSKETKCIGKWAKATANMLQIEEEEGFDALVDLFDASMEKNRPDGCIGLSQNSNDDDVDDDGSHNCIIDGPLSPISRPLTPKGKRVAEAIETAVKDDPPKESAIERMCPNWKENVRLAQAQTDPIDLCNALQNVQQAKTDLENMKEKILQAFLDRHQTLHLYEKCLQCSIDRLSENEGEDDCT